MTPEQQRIAIAELCGWKWDGQFTPNPEVCGWIRTNDIFWSRLPNYPADLNACARVAKLLGTSAEWSRKYIDFLKEVGAFEGIEATAPQRCEAILRALGLWVET